MCTGVEMLMVAGSVLGGVSAVKQLTSKPKAPQVVQTSPLADQAKAEAEARMVQRRRTRNSSLLASGGAGDTSPLATGQPAATAGKLTLGS